MCAGLHDWNLGQAAFPVTGQLKIKLGSVSGVKEFLFDFISQYGYVALYLLLSAGMVGVPIPDETLMVFIGSLTALGGPFDFGPTLAVIYAGTMTGMTVSYLIGHRVGKPFLNRYGKWVKLTPSRIERAEGWFKKYGLWTVFFGYFVPGVRHFTCYLSGVSGVKFYKYMLYAGYRSAALVYNLSNTGPIYRQ